MCGMQGMEAVAQCMIVSHWTSTDIGCLLTLKSAAGSSGVALDQAGLKLASRSGSEAATVCPVSLDAFALLSSADTSSSVRAG